MKTLFATLVIVGLATCTIGSEAVNRERDYLREATTATEQNPYYLETEKYHRRENLGIEDEEGIIGKVHSRVAGSKKTRSESLEKLLRGGDRRAHEFSGKKKRREEVLLSRGDLNKDNLFEEKYEEAEKLLRDQKDKLREKKDIFIKKYVTNP